MSGPAREPHLTRRLYGAEFDCPVRTPPPMATYMLASIPRSGSTFFSVRLWKTGCLGAPMEYANTTVLEKVGMIRRLRCSGFEEFWKRVPNHRTSDNGVFGYKMFASQFLYISRCFPQLLETIAPTHVLYLTREDIQAQAISYSRAVRTKVWFAGTQSRDDSAYDYEHIRLFEQQIRDQQQFWEGVFQTTGAQVLRLSYEEVICDPDEAVRKSAAFMGIQLDPAKRVPIPDLERQADEASKAWRKRYASERATKDESIFDEVVLNPWLELKAQASKTGNHT